MRALASTAVHWLLVIPALAIPAGHEPLAQERTLLDGKPALVIANDKLTLGVRTRAAPWSEWC